MRLPLYGEFENFKFDFLLNPTLRGEQGGGTFIDLPIVRSYYNSFFAITLSSNGYNGEKASFVFVY